MRAADEEDASAGHPTVMMAEMSFGLLLQYLIMQNYANLLKDYAEGINQVQAS